MGNKVQAAEKKSVAKHQKKMMQRRLRVSKTQMKRISQQGQRSLGKLGKTTSLRKRGRTISAVEKNLYKCCVQKAKETLGIKMKEIGLANMMEQRELMAASLMAAKEDAAGTVSNYRLVKTRRNQLMGELDCALNELMRFRALETLLMQDLGFL